MPLPAKEIARDRVLDDREFAQVILAARKIGGPYGGIVELLALTGQRREEVAGLPWEELDFAQKIWTIPKARTKNAKAHIVHLSKQVMSTLSAQTGEGRSCSHRSEPRGFQDFTHAKRLLDHLSGVTPAGGSCWGGAAATAFGILMILAPFGRSGRPPRARIAAIAHPTIDAIASCSRRR